MCAIKVGGARRAPGFTQHVSELLNFEPFSLGEPEKEDALDEALQVEVSADSVDYVMPENIVGTRAMKRKIKQVLEKYARRFRKTVAKEAANMKPMVLKVDTQKWEDSKETTRRYRPQSDAKHDEIDRQCKKLLDLGVIQHSTSSHWSQVLLVPKPDGKWRFCLDFRYLNACTEMEGGAIPIIHEMLRRIGAKKPKYFAVSNRFYQRISPSAASRRIAKIYRF